MSEAADPNTTTTDDVGATAAEEAQRRSDEALADRERRAELERLRARLGRMFHQGP